MKFKAKLHNAVTLLRILQALEKVHKTCTVKLSRGTLRFICRGETTDSIQVWGSLKTNYLFSDFKIQSQLNNDIYFRTDLRHFIKGLKSSPNANETVLKLSKKQGQPYLSVETKRQQNSVISISQDIPIVILRHDEIEYLIEPKLPEPRVKIFMPNVRDMKPVVERMKSVSDYMTISASMAGTLSLRVGTSDVDITTVYNGLAHPRIDGFETFESDPDTRAQAKVDLKSFQKFLHVHLIGAEHIICSILDERVVIMNTLVGDQADFVYYLPAKVS